MKKILILFLATILLFSSCLKREKVVVDKTSKELTVWNLFDDSDVFEGQIQSFISLNPGAVIKYKKFSKIDFYEDLLLNQLAEGKGPDIFVIKNTDLQKWKGKLEPLFIGGTKKPMNLQIYNETFLPVLSQNLIDEGKIYGMSAYVDTLALYYNKSYFEDNFASGKPATTWNKLTKQVQQMTRTNNSIEKFALSGIAMGRSDNISRAVDILYLLMMQYGTQFFDEKAGKAIFGDVQGNRNKPGKSQQPGEKALTLYTSYGKSLFKNYSWNKNMTAKYEEKTELHPFVTGKTAAIFGYSYLKDDLVKLISQYKSKGVEAISKKDIGITEVPQVGNFTDTGKRDALVSYFPFVVSKNTKNPKLAWDFLMYLSSKESSLDYFEKTNKISSRLDLIEDQKLEKTYGVFARLASYGKSYPNFIIDSTKYDIIFANAIDEISNSKAKPKTAISFAQRQIQCLIDKDKLSDIYKKCL